MKWKDWLAEWKMTKLNISMPYLEMEWQPSDPDKAAAWDLYIELLTRIATQPLDDKHGKEQSALDSVFSLFATTRSILKTHGRECSEFTKIAIVVLNQVVRPFTAKWHKISSESGFDDPAVASTFRSELKELQEVLRRYTGMLAQMAGVEDNLLTLMEQS